jgi:hypothetical protein
LRRRSENKKYTVRVPKNPAGDAISPGSRDFRTCSKTRSHNMPPLVDVVEINKPGLADHAERG